MRYVSFCFLLIFVLMPFSGRADNDARLLLLGKWGGSASYSGSQTPLELDFTRNEKGDIAALFDLPETNVMNVPIGKVVNEEKGFRVWKFSFQLDQAQTSMDGIYRYGERDIAFHLKKNVSVAPPSRLTPARKIARPAWIFNANAPIWSSPTADRGVVYFGSNDGTFYALAADSGKLIWKFQTERPIVARPTIDHGFLYVASDDGFLYKLNQETGKQIWRFDTGGGKVERGFPDGKDPRYDYFASSPTLASGVIYVGSANGKLFAIDDQSGTQKWEYQTKDIVRSTPIVAERLIIFASRDHNVYALEEATGKLRWTVDTGDVVVSSPVYADGIVYIGSRSSDVFAIRAQSGKILWRYFYWLSWVESSGVVRDQNLYIGSSDYQLVFDLDTKTGKPIWKFDTDGSAWCTPAVTRDSVFIGAVGTVGYMADHHGAFFAINRKNGKEKWRFVFNEIPGSFTYGVASSPVVYQDRVFFGSIDGKFYAFNIKG